MTTGPLRLCVVFLTALAALFAPRALAQRQMESLGRGLVALRTSGTQTYVGWRLLGNDPQELAFNLYRSANGGAPVKINAAPLTATTDYVDTPPNLGTTAYAYSVRPVLNGVEVADAWANPAAPASFPLIANPPTRQYFPVALQAPPGGANADYSVKFCWVGDLDGDGEFDFVVDRLNRVVTSTQWLQAYKRDGTLLWQMNMGPNSLDQDNIYGGSSTISSGQSDGVVVYDLDGDGKAEVAVRTARGVIFNYGAATQSTLTAPDDEVQYVSVVDGLTGAEKARSLIPIPAGWATRTHLLSANMGIVYADGARPSVFLHGKNRNPSLSFNNMAATWDYRGGVLSLRWTWDGVAESGHTAEGHQVRFADVNNDGTDEYVDVGHVLKADGSGLINGDKLTEVVHGDRFHIADIDPARPGLETYIIQQNNPGGLATAYHSADRSDVIKKLYASGVIDVGRGTIGAFVPSLAGLQMFSTFGGTYDAKGNQIYASAPFPPETIWWDGDLGREFLSTIGGSATSPGIDKFNTANASTSRLLSLYSDPAAPGYPYNNYIAYGGRPQFWGDILGDWREELLCVASGNSELRVYTTRTPDVAKTHDGASFRIYALMHNPQYRVQATAKGYVQSSYVDYYLGHGMPPPPPPPMVGAKLVWKGGPGASVWDAGSTLAWKNSSTSSAAVFSAGDTVRFDLSGDNSGSVALSGTLQPGAVAVYSPKDYIFSGSGSLTGPMRLLKSGAGSLVLAGNHGFTGATTVWDGALRVDGALSGSAVTVWGGTWGGAAAKGLTGGRLAGSGLISQPVTLRHRGAITPGGGMGSAGTLTLGAGLSARDGAVLAFDLSDDPGGVARPNDRLVITGNLSLTGTVSIVINPTAAKLSPGTYTLATYTGSLVGSASNLSVIVPDGTPYTIAVGSGALTLAIPVTRSADTVTWTGSVSAAWDVANSLNWTLDGSPTVFISGDSVVLNDTGATRPSISLNSAMPVAGMTVSGSTHYTLSGAGSISGPGGLAKSGPGTLTLNTTNTFTGPVSIRGGAIAVSSLGDAGQPGSLGASTADTSNLVIDGGTLRLVGPQTSTNRNLTIGASGGVVDIASAGSSIQISGTVAGAGRLTKSGPGTLLFANANTYAGGTVINGGKIYLAGSAANEGGLGSGDITINNGTLSMADVQNNDVAAWNLIVPSGAVARLDADGRCGLTGTLSGSGNLTYYSPYIRSDLRGNWSAFSGRVFHVGGDLRIANASGYANAAIDLGAGTYASYVLTTSSTGTTVPVGELSGASTAVLAGGPTGGRTLTWQIGARNTDSTFAGSIRNSGGATALAKVGAGTLVLSGNNTYNGPTTVSAGKLVIAGGGALSGNGTIGTAVTVAAGAGFGGSGAVVGTVAFNAGSILLANPAAPLSIIGNLAFSGNVTVAPAPGAVLAAGTYPFLTYTGSLTGSPVFAWNGPGFNAAFNTSVPGQITLTLAADTGRAVSNLAWTGASSSVWDAAAANWTHAAGATAFKDGDAVAFTDAASVTSLTLSGALRPASVAVNATRNYSLSGSGQLAGDASLTKSGSGSLTLSTANSHLGGVTLQSGTLVLGHASALGSGTLTLAGGTLDTGALAIANLINVTGNATIVGGDSGGAHGLGGIVSGAADTLTLATSTVFDIEGNITPFAGRIALSGSGSFRLNGSAGSAFAEWSLGNRTLSARGGSSFSLGALSGLAGSMLNNSTSNSGNVTYSVGALGRDTAFAGVIANGNSTRATALAKVGAGALVLSGNHTYTGPTTVSAGSLLVTGALGPTPVAVSAGAAVGGTGSLGGSLTLAAGSRLALGVGPSATRGLAVAGATTIEGGITVVPALLGGALTPGSYPLLTYTGTLAGAPAFAWLDTTGSGYAAAFDTATPGVVSIRLVAPPVIPAGLAAVAGDGRVDLSWNPVPDAASYTVLRSAVGGSGYAVVASGLAAAAYADTGLPNGVACHYVVTAANLAGTSAWSHQASATPRAPAPSGLLAAAGDGRVDLSWNAVPGAAGYALFRSTTAGTGRQIIATNLASTAYADTGVVNGITYYYVVSALDAAGPGPASNESSATPVHPLSPIEVWRVTHFGAPEALEDGADLADPDGDGAANLLEYALGSDPTSPGPKACQPSRADGVLKLTFTRVDDPSLAYTVQGSIDLAVWTDLWTSSGAANTSGPVTVSDPSALAGFTRRFLRLRVSITP